MSALAQPDIVEPLEGTQTMSNLTDDESCNLLAEMWRSGNMPRRGRPKKGSGQLRWADFGFTRQRVHEWRRMAEIPDDHVRRSTLPKNDSGEHARVPAGIVRLRSRAPLVFVGPGTHDSRNLTACFRSS
jgi:hypothetical protein